MLLTHFCRVVWVAGIEKILSQRPGSLRSLESPGHLDLSVLSVSTKVRSMDIGRVLFQ